MMTVFWTLALLIAVGTVIRVAFDAEVKACFERDPAARNLAEVLLTYSGLHVVVVHRLAHALDQVKIPVIPRLLMTVAR